ncbi:hypothetical protein [Paraburkholderia diazotrophica]|uniref:hypothetical protein n=1 Tax=Paraburkholderia diazotrophica TaxID=667676 RepID=UPI0015A5230A|nr:hypothetical protein [Paraburkholderia diazotrophica]
MKAADIAQTVRTLLNAIRNTYFQKRLKLPLRADCTAITRQIKAQKSIYAALVAQAD